MPRTKGGKKKSTISSTNGISIEKATPVEQQDTIELIGATQDISTLQNPYQLLLDKIKNDDTIIDIRVAVIGNVW